jgi:hypothetical protein
MTSFRILGLGLGVPSDVQRYHGTFSEYPGWKWALLGFLVFGLSWFNVLDSKYLMCTMDNHNMQ